MSQQKKVAPKQCFHKKQWGRFFIFDIGVGVKVYIPNTSHAITENAIVENAIVEMQSLKI